MVVLVPPMIRVRRATDEDCPHLPEIERSSGELFRHEPGLEWIADDTVQSVEQHRALLATGLALVAEVDGFGLTAFLNGEPAADALHIWQIAVHHDQQRRGLGRTLINSAQDYAADRGINALTLTTFRDIAWNEPFYRKLGFVTLEEAELSPRLRAILTAEGRAGMPLARRCAMRKPV